MVQMHNLGGFGSAFGVHQDDRCEGRAQGGAQGCIPELAPAAGEVIPGLSS